MHGTGRSGTEGARATLRFAVNGNQGRRPCHSSRRLQAHLRPLRARHRRGPSRTALALACNRHPVAIWLNDGRPIFFTQERVGLGDRDFRIIKFRSMQMPSSADRTPTTALSHVTAVGRLLRPLHLDELPQVVNILRGEMSLVGPRAEWRPRHDLICKQLPEFAQRLRVRPGIAGLAQARGHYWSIPREKLRYDNLYIDSLGPWLDIKLIFLCFYAAIRRARSPTIITATPHTCTSTRTNWMRKSTSCGRSLSCLAKATSRPNRTISRPGFT